MTFEVIFLMHKLGSKLKKTLATITVFYCSYYACRKHHTYDKPKTNNGG